MSEARFATDAVLSSEQVQQLMLPLHCCRPAHALYFATYELAKESLGGNEGGHHPAATAVAGAIATIVNDGVMTPSDVIKQRLQVANSPYKGVLDCVLRIQREEGLATFFKSYRTTVSVFQSLCHVVTLPPPAAQHS